MSQELNELKQEYKFDGVQYAPHTQKITTVEIFNWSYELDKYDTAQAVSHENRYVQGNHIKIASALISKFVKHQENVSFRLHNRFSLTDYQIGMWLLEGIAYYGNENQIKFVLNAAKKGYWIDHSGSYGSNLHDAMKTLVERGLITREDFVMYLHRANRYEMDGADRATEFNLSVKDDNEILKEIEASTLLQEQLDFQRSVFGWTVDSYSFRVWLQSR